MVLAICLQNVDGASLDAAAPTSSNSHGKPPTALPSTLFRSDSPSSDHEKTDKGPVGGFLWQGVCRRIGIKGSSPKYVSLCKYTWEVVAYMVKLGEGRSGLNIWPETPNQDSGTEDMIFITWSKEAMK